MEKDRSKRLLIIDSNSLIHRAYHALPSLTTRKGELVNAVYGFLLIFFKAIREFQPNFVVATFDYPAPTFRHRRYKEYKAKRPPAPEELYRQIPRLKEILKKFEVPIFEKEGYEADDIIGTITHLAIKKQKWPEIEIIILSGDLDSLQLVNSQTKVYLLRKGVKDIVLYDQALLKRKYQGLTSEQLLDYRALRGDPSDNIPGVRGIGEKTAINLLLKFGNLENLYRELGENSPKAKELSPKIRETLLNYKEEAFFSKNLSRIKKNLSLDFNLEKCRWGNYRPQEVIKALEKFEFYSLIKRLTNEKKN